MVRHRVKVRGTHTLGRVAAARLAQSGKKRLGLPHRLAPGAGSFRADAGGGDAARVVG